MPMTPGLAPNIRQISQEDMDALPILQIIEGEDKEHANDDGDVLQIEHDDGSVTISIDGKPLVDREERGPDGWALVVEDFKGWDMPEARFRRAVFEAMTGIPVRLTR